jgi:glycosyltransferase involved in cell wall biosynthesis
LRGGALRFGFLIDRWQPARGGAERALAQFAAHLEERGHEVLAFGLAGPRQGEPAPARFVRVRTAGFTRGARERRFASAALEAAAAARCDATVAVRHVPRCDLYWPHGGAHGATLRALGKRARGRHRAFLALEREALGGGARCVVCVSELVRAELASAYPRSVARLRVVPNGIDLERFQPSARAAARGRLDERRGGSAAVRVGFLGRNARLKGLDTLLEPSLASLIARRC